VGRLSRGQRWPSSEARRGSGGGGSRPAVDGEEVDLSHGQGSAGRRRTGSPQDV
jgi:hypothetical protein